eukprot:scaffold109936_cov57-Attheya_sp.AAC.2
MQRQSDRDGADLHNGLKSQHRDSAVYISGTDALALVYKGKQKGVRRTALGCHFGRREFGLRRALC